MKIVFVSNYFNHHQKPFCEEMYRHLDGNFVFVSTAMMREERKVLGYVQNDFPKYVILAYEGKQQMEQALSFIDEADIVIMGSAPEKMISSHVRSGKLTFRYSERPYKRKPNSLKKFYHFFHWRSRNYFNKNVYLLCAGAYTAGDYASVGMYKKRTYKWGYFPVVHKYDIDELISHKKINTLLWCGRFIDWKHPEDAIGVAEKLKRDGYDFRLNMIGTGILENELKRIVSEMNLDGYVNFIGPMSPERVREHMEEAGIYLFTSDRIEGWGAVLNESMNSCCAVIANHSIGSTPFLIEDNENGLIYRREIRDDLYSKVKYLMDNPNKLKIIGKNGYKTIADLWNAEIAAERFISLVSHILNKNDLEELYKNGPCSPAEIILDD